MQALDILPALGQQRDKEVNGLVEVLPQLFDAEGVDAEALGQPGELLYSETDGPDQLINLFLHCLPLAQRHRQLSDGGHVPTDQLGHVLVDRLGDEDRVELTGPFLDQLGLVVELFQVVLGDGLESQGLGLLDVLHGSDDADFEVRPAVGIEGGGRVETLFFLGVVVAQHDLQLEGFHEFALLAVGKRVLDRFLDLLVGDLAHTAIYNSTAAVIYGVLILV